MVHTGPKSSMEPDSWGQKIIWSSFKKRVEKNWRNPKLEKNHHHFSRSKRHFFREFFLRFVSIETPPIVPMGGTQWHSGDHDLRWCLAPREVGDFSPTEDAGHFLQDLFLGILVSKRKTWNEIIYNQIYNCLLTTVICYYLYIYIYIYIDSSGS